MRFSLSELWDLFKAWIAISLAFGILNARSSSPPMLAITFLISAGTVGVGFLLHELAHKVLAQRYGCFAEFQADNKMLVVAVLSSFLGFIFAAPGAVYISGYVGVIRNGKISLAGPITNIVLALGFLSLNFLSISAVWSFVGLIGFSINSWLALFNMLPFGGLDGKKVYIWSKKVFWLWMGISFVMVLVSWAL